MADPVTTERLEAASSTPRPAIGALVGLVVVLLFTVAHDIFISDIWFNAGPMLFAGALCGLCIVWSYRSGVRRHSRAAWFAYNALISVEMLVIGLVSLAVFEPRFTMAELIVRDDAIDVLMPPSIPLMAGAMILGTLAFWLYFDRSWQAMTPILATQVLLVFLLGHQFAFLGLVESSSLLARAFAEFAAITFVLAGVFAGGVAWVTVAVDRSTSSA